MKVFINIQHPVDVKRKDGVIHIRSMNLPETTGSRAQRELMARAASDRRYKHRRDFHDSRRDLHESRRDLYKGRRDLYEGRRDLYESQQDLHEPPPLHERRRGVELASAAAGHCQSDEQAKAAAIEQRHERAAQTPIKVKLVKRKINNKLAAMIDKYERIAKKRDKRLKAVSKGRQKDAQAQIAMIEKYERAAKRVIRLKAKLRQLRNEAAEENARMTLLPKKPCVKSLKGKQEPRDGSLKVKQEPRDGSLKVKQEPRDGSLKVKQKPRDGSLKVKQEPLDGSLKVKQEPRDGSGSEQDESWRGGKTKDPNGADCATTGSAARGTSQGSSTSY